MSVPGPRRPIKSLSLSKRNAGILTDRRKGVTLTVLAEKHGVSRVRIVQILRRQAELAGLEWPLVIPEKTKR